MADYSELKRKAQEIRDEVKAGANTANRVGLALEETVKALEAENQRAEQAEVSLENAVQMLQDETEDLPSIREQLETLVVNDLTTGGADKALSAEMGKALSAELTELGEEVKNIGPTVDNLNDVLYYSYETLKGDYENYFRLPVTLESGKNYKIIIDFVGPYIKDNGNSATLAVVGLTIGSSLTDLNKFTGFAPTDRHLEYSFIADKSYNTLYNAFNTGHIRGSDDKISVKIIDLSESVTEKVEKEIDELNTRVDDVTDIIGHKSYTYVKSDSGSFPVSGFGSKIIISELSIKAGQTIKIEIKGNATRSTQRLYINRAGGEAINIIDKGDVSTFWTATEDVNSLHFYTTVTAEGTLSMSVSYDVPASGITEAIGRFENAYPTISQVVGEIIDVTTIDNPTWSLGANGNRTIMEYVTEADNCTLTCILKNVVGDYSQARMVFPSLNDMSYHSLKKNLEGSYFGSRSLIGLPKGSVIRIVLFTDNTHEGSQNGSCELAIQEQSYNGNSYPRIDILTTDSQFDIFNKMLYANNIGHCDVHFQTGTYYFDETLFDWMRSERVSGRCELPIGGGCRYFFNGATLIGSYAGDDEIARQNCNVIGCGMTSGNFELHDGTIIANDIVYGVHDDCGADGLGDSHVHKYHNMHIIYNGGTFAKDHAINKCIGGGTSRNVSVIIDGCVLEKYTENANKDCVTYHGLANNPSYAVKSRILITNTWMNGGCGAYHLVNTPRNETIEFVVSNCHTNIGNVDVDKLFTWNNEASEVV